MKLLAANYLIDIIINCPSVRASISYTLEAATLGDKTCSFYCSINSTKGILVAQFSNGNNDPFSNVLNTPSTIHYSSRFALSTIWFSNINHLIHINVPKQFYHPEKIFALYSNSTIPIGAQFRWSHIGNADNDTEAYVLHLAANEGRCQIILSDKDAFNSCRLYKSVKKIEIV